MKTTTVLINDNMLGRIDGLATTLSRSRSWIINQAIERFRAERLVNEWAGFYQKELSEMWNRQEFKRLPGLE